MVECEPLVLPPTAAAEAKAFVRAVHGEDDALIETLVRASAEVCETYTRRLLLARGVGETLRLDEGWIRLSRTPVREINMVAAVAPDGGVTPLRPEDHAIDIDAHGDGWVRLVNCATRRVRVGYRAGLAEDWATLPDALRHGVVRLAGHFYALRSEAGPGSPRVEPPASVAALWRPYRRVSLC